VQLPHRHQHPVLHHPRLSPSGVPSKDRTAASTCPPTSSSPDCAHWRLRPPAFIVPCTSGRSRARRARGHRRARRPRCGEEPAPTSPPSSLGASSSPSRPPALYPTASASTPALEL